MKDEILHTALGQFLKYGIREMSIKRLIEPLGISTKTVYKYFSNKEDLLKEVLQLHYSQQYQLLEELSASRNAVVLLFDTWYLAIERVQDVNNRFYHDLHYYYPRLEKEMESAVGRKFGIQFRNMIRKGIEEEQFQANLHPELAMEGIYILYNAITRTDLFDRFGVTMDEIILNTVANYIRGLCTAKGMLCLEAHLEKMKSSGFKNSILLTS